MMTTKYMYHNRFIYHKSMTSLIKILLIMKDISMESNAL